MLVYFLILLVLGSFLKLFAEVAGSAAVLFNVAAFGFWLAAAGVIAYAWYQQRRDNAASSRS